MRLLFWVTASIAAFMVTLTFALASALGGGTMGAAGAFPAGLNFGLDAEQAHNATIALTVSDEVGAPALAVEAMIVAALGESDLRVVANAGGSGYCGVWQADPSNIACDDTELQARSFLRGGLGFQAGGAIHLARLDSSLTPGMIATMVEASGQPESFYNAHRPLARRIIGAWRSGAVVVFVGPVTEVGRGGGPWLADVPGSLGTICDARIVLDVADLIRRYHLSAGDCYATSGHAADGEHPLGLGIDLVPGSEGSWDDVDRLARDVGWVRSCGASGVRPACPLKPWVRFVGYDGYPNHGRGNHLHISWQHGLGRPAETVTVFSGAG